MTSTISAFILDGRSFQGQGCTLKRSHLCIGCGTTETPPGRHLNHKSFKAHGSAGTAKC